MPCTRRTGSIFLHGHLSGDANTLEDWSAFLKINNPMAHPVFQHREVLSNGIFPFIGLGHHAQIAIVCRSFREAYTHFCRDHNDGELHKTYVHHNIQSMMNILSLVEEEGFPIAAGVSRRLHTKVPSLLCNIAAQHIGLAMLKILYNAGSPIDEDTCSACANNFSLSQIEVQDCLEWLRKKECAWDVLTTQNLYDRGYNRLANWAIHHGCPAEEGIVDATRDAESELGNSEMEELEEEYERILRGYDDIFDAL